MISFETIDEPNILLVSNANSFCNFLVNYVVGTFKFVALFYNYVPISWRLHTYKIEACVQHNVLCTSGYVSIDWIVNKINIIAIVVMIIIDT